MIQKDNSDIMNLWILYKKDCDIQYRNQLLVHYSDLVNRVVNRIAVKYGPYIDVDDLIGCGIFGLIDAIEKFDINKGVKFETYASFRIRGEIIDRIRDQDWIPRSLRTRSKEMEKALEELEAKLGRQVQDEELAAYMGITTKELHKLMEQTHSFTLLSLDDQLLGFVEDSQVMAGNQRTPEDHAIAEELKRILSQAIEQLTEKEQKIISLYYFDELTLKEIGMILGISESRVSQLHSRSLIKIKNKLKTVRAF